MLATFEGQTARAAETSSERTEVSEHAALYQIADGPYAVKSVEKLVLRDNKQGKELQLKITYPDGKGKFPVIIWSHGAYGSKDSYEPLIRHWAGYGYVCIQANHSDSRSLGVRFGDRAAFKDWKSRPRDVSFVIDSLDEIASEVQGLAEKMDRAAIGVGGHSYGAHTAQLVAGVTTTSGRRGERESHTDKRPQAFLLISPQGTGEMLDRNSWRELTRPAMVITGSMDNSKRTNKSYTWRMEPFDYAPPGNKYLLFIQGADHSFGGITGRTSGLRLGSTNVDHVDYVKSASVAFWDAYLKHNEKAMGYLHSSQLFEATGGKAKITSVSPALDRENRYLW